MSERLHLLTMRGFRGVPGELSVDFGPGQSLAVYGDNGTGKSTIADALEWFFTGGIELLSHEGRQHAIRNLGGAGASETSVEVVTSGGLGGRVIFPDERGPEAFGVASRETFLLRGRTLADFINKTKTEKWKALAEILGLEEVEKLRSDLQRARSDLKKTLKTAEEKLSSAERLLSPEGGDVTEASILGGLQEVCRALGVQVPETLDRVQDPAWLAAVAGGSAVPAGPSLESLVSALRAPALDREAIREWSRILASERAQDLERLSLLRDADALLKSTPAAAQCPVCGQPVDAAMLAARVESTIGELLQASQEMERVREAVRATREGMTSAIESRRSLHRQAKILGAVLPDPPSMEGEPFSGLERRSPIDLAALESVVRQLEGWDAGAKAVLEAARPGASDPRQSQLAMLAALCDQIRAWRSARIEVARFRRAHELAERVYDAYQQRQKEQLQEILGSISRRVAEIYQALHPGEDLGGITVEPWTAKGVELAVDFHGSKQRPPHGVLSESHLNSLAIALFLAMAQTFNQKLRFLVLDDVINSFDLEHRGQLAALLAERFEDWQLVVLTHDHQFFEHLSRRAPSWNRLEITSWSYDEGPRTTRYDSAGILGEARDRLAQGDVNGAATKARRALEELLQEICEELEAELAFRRGTRNDRRELGELFKGVRRCLKEHARSLLGKLEPLLKNLEADVQATLNVEAHASRGRSAASEVESALRRIEELDLTWSCPDCRSRVWHRGTPQSFRCKCGKSLFPPT